MWELLQRYRSFVLVGALIIAPLVLLYAQTRSPGARGPVVGVIIDGASVVERALLWGTGGISDVLQEYVTSVASHEELADLRRENARASSLRVRVAELEHENEVLRGMAHVAERIDGPRPIGARVIGRSGAPLTRILRIDRGRYDGLARGDGVVTSRGVIGRVLSAGIHASDVLLLTDPSAAIDVVSQRTRARGIVRGTGEVRGYRARVEDFDRLADVRVGDSLVTSGLGGKFPPGLLVGEVTDVELRQDGLYQLADVKPAADVARVEHVLVLVARDPERMPRLAGEDEGVPLDGGPAAETGAPLPPALKARAAVVPVAPASSPVPSTTPEAAGAAHAREPSGDPSEPREPREPSGEPNEPSEPSEPSEPAAATSAPEIPAPPPASPAPVEAPPLAPVPSPEPIDPPEESPPAEEPPP